MDKRITEAEKDLNRWSRAIATQWSETCHFINSHGLLCEETLTVKVGRVTIFVTNTTPRETYFNISPSDQSHPVGEMALRPEFDITLLPKIREKVIAAIETLKKKVERHLAKIENAIEPLRPDIAEQVLEDGRKEAKGESADVKAGGITSTSAPTPHELGFSPGVGDVVDGAPSNIFKKVLRKASRDSINRAAKR